MARIEKVRYWRGKHATIPNAHVSGRLLFEEDTGDVFLEYLDLTSGEVKRIQLTDNRKVNRSGDTFTGDLILHHNPIKKMEAATKAYVDAVDSSLDAHVGDTIIHITEAERAKWNNKVDKVAGKQLSTNDFTNAYKQKLDAISPEADDIQFEPIQLSGTALGEITINGNTSTIYAPQIKDITGNANSATKLKNARTIDGISFNGQYDISHYSRCATTGSDKYKTATIDRYVLAQGSQATVYFENSNTAQEPTLNISDTGAFPITYQGQPIAVDKLKSGLHTFVYNGTSYEIVNGIDPEYQPATSSKAGLMSPQDKSNLDAIKTKVDGIESGANNYVLPKATKTTLGGVIVGNNISLNTADGTIYLTSSDVVNALGYTPFDGAINATTIKNLIGAFKGATTSADGDMGFVPAPKKSSADYNKFLKGDGTWANIDAVSGATAGAAGAAGLAPAPPAGAQNYFLKGTGQWADVFADTLKVAAPTSQQASPTGGYYLRGDNTWQKLFEVPEPTSSQTTCYLRGDGTWQPITAPVTMRGATVSAAGSAGYAPQPAAGANTKYLRGDATWQDPFDGMMKVPKPTSSQTTYYLRGDGTWQSISQVSPVTMTGATSSRAGSAGYAPQPAAGANTKYLRGDATWIDPFDGLMKVPQPSSSQTNYYLKGDGTWTAIPANHGAIPNSDIDAICV